MRARAKVRHRAQVTLLRRRKSIESNSEEAFVQGRGRLMGCANGIPQPDRGPLCDVPAVLSPFLQEVGIAMSRLDDLLKCCRLKLHILLTGRFRDRLTSGLLRQRADFGEVEQAFRVRLRMPHSTTKLWESGAHQRDGQLALGTAMESGDEGGQLGLVDVLQFVDEQDEGGARARSRFTDRFQKCREV